MHVKYIKKQCLEVENYLFKNVLLFILQQNTIKWCRYKDFKPNINLNKGKRKDFSF